MQLEIQDVFAGGVLEATRKPRIDLRSWRDGATDTPQRDGGGIRLDLVEQAGVVVGPDFPADVIESGLVAPLSDLTQRQGFFVVIRSAILGIGGSNFLHPIHIFALSRSKLSLGIRLGIGGIQSFVQGAEGIRGGLGINLPRITIEEVERIIKALFLAHLHGALGDVPHALARIQCIDGTPVEVERNIELIPWPRPSLVHLRPPKQGNALGVDEVGEKIVHRSAFAAQMVPPRERPVLDAKAILECGGRPFPLFHIVIFTALGFGRDTV